jgi:hypothetical protein
MTRPNTVCTDGRADRDEDGRVELDGAGRITCRRRCDILHGRSEASLGGDGAADRLSGAGDAVSTTARDVYLHLAGRGDDVRCVRLRS